MKALHDLYLSKNQNANKTVLLARDLYGTDHSSDYSSKKAAWKLISNDLQDTFTDYSSELENIQWQQIVESKKKLPNYLDTLLSLIQRGLSATGQQLKMILEQISHYMQRFWNYASSFIRGDYTALQETEEESYSFFSRIATYSFKFLARMSNVFLNGLYSIVDGFLTVLSYTCEKLSMCIHGSIDTLIKLKNTASDVRDALAKIGFYILSSVHEMVDLMKKQRGEQGQLQDIVFPIMKSIVGKLSSFSFELSMYLRAYLSRILNENVISEYLKKLSVPLEWIVAHISRINDFVSSITSSVFTVYSTFYAVIPALLTMFGPFLEKTKKDLETSPFDNTDIPTLNEMQQEAKDLLEDQRIDEMQRKNLNSLIDEIERSQTQQAEFDKERIREQQQQKNPDTNYSKSASILYNIFKFEEKYKVNNGDTIDIDAALEILEEAMPEILKRHDLMNSTISLEFKMMASITISKAQSAQLRKQKSNDINAMYESIGGGAGLSPSDLKSPNMESYIENLAHFTESELLDEQDIVEDELKDIWKHIEKTKEEREITRENAFKVDMRRSKKKTDSMSGDHVKTEKALIKLQRQNMTNYKLFQDSMLYENLLEFSTLVNKHNAISVILNNRYSKQNYYYTKLMLATISMISGVYLFYFVTFQTDFVRLYVPWANYISDIFDNFLSRISDPDPTPTHTSLFKALEEIVKNAEFGKKTFFESLSIIIGWAPLISSITVISLNFLSLSMLALFIIPAWLFNLKTFEKTWNFVKFKSSETFLAISLLGLQSIAMPDNTVATFLKYTLAVGTVAVTAYTGLHKVAGSEAMNIVKMTSGDYYRNQTLKTIRMSEKILNASFFQFNPLKRLLTPFIAQRLMYDARHPYLEAKLYFVLDEFMSDFDIDMYFKQLKTSNVERLELDDSETKTNLTMYQKATLNTLNQLYKRK